MCSDLMFRFEVCLSYSTYTHSLSVTSIYYKYIYILEHWNKRVVSPREALRSVVCSPSVPIAALKPINFINYEHEIFHALMRSQLIATELTVHHES